MKFELGPGLKCDLAVLMESRLLIQAQSGGGKSRTLRRLLEQTHGKVQQLIIDPEGEFSTLREKFDYVLAAAAGGDAHAHPRTAAMLAERLLDLKASAVLDLYDLKPPQRREFVKLFCEALIDAPKRLRHPCIVAIDEAQMFAPEGGKAESAAAVADLAVRGRKRGLCLVAAVARLSEFDKATAAPLLNKLIGLTTLDLDMQRAAKDLGFDKAGMLGLRELEKMQFWGFGPALVRAPTLVTIGPHETTHPRPGARLTAEVAPPPTEKIKALLPQLADLPAEAEQKQKSLDDLKRDNAELRRQLTIAQRQAPTPPAPAKPERIEVPILTQENLQELQRTVTMIRNVLEHTAMLTSSLTDARGELGKAIDEIQRAVAKATAPRPAGPAPRPLQTRAIPAPPRERPVPTPPASADGIVGKVEQRILDSLAELEAMGFTPTDKRQLAFFAGYTNIRSGGFSEPLGRLVTSGLIHSPAPGVVTSTEAGRAIARPSDMPATSEALQERILEKLDGPRKKLLRVLIDAYPDDMSKVEHAERCGYANIRSGGYSEPLGSMVTVGLVDSPVPGRVRAADALFLESAGAHR